MLENGKWISYSENYGNVCPIFHRNFGLNKVVKKAKLKITALGCYIAYINGQRVGDFVFAPGWTSYDKRLQVQEYDITKMLSKENILTYSRLSDISLPKAPAFEQRAPPTVAGMEQRPSNPV